VLPDEASMVKYASNAFHAVKVAFANEIGAVCQQLAIDGATPSAAEIEQFRIDRPILLEREPATSFMV